MRPGIRKTLIAAAAVVVATALTVEVVHAVADSVLHWPFDLRIYVWGGRTVTADRRLYDTLAHGLWFTYPPFAATVFVPLAMLPGIVTRALWTSSSVAAIAVSCASTMRLCGARATLARIAACSACAMVLAPVQQTLELGQINLILMAVVLVDVERLARGRRAGVGIGVAAAIKLVPAVFAVWLLLARRTDAAIRAGIAFVACAFVGWLVAPSASVRYWLHLSHDTTRVGARYISNQSPFAMVARFADTDSPDRWYVLVPLLVAAVALPTAAHLARDGDWLAGVSTAAFAGLLMSPISWAHHWVWIVPAIAVLWRLGPWARAALVPTAVVFVTAPMWHTPKHGGPAARGWQGLTTLQANCYLVFGVLFLATMAWHAWSRRDQPAMAANPTAVLT